MSETIILLIIGICAIALVIFAMPKGSSTVEPVVISGRDAVYHGLALAYQRCQGRNCGPDVVVVVKQEDTDQQFYPHLVNWASQCTINEGRVFIQVIE